MTLNVLFITVGQVVAYVVGWLFVQWGNENTAWRWIVGLGAVPAGVQSKCHFSLFHCCWEMGNMFFLNMLI